MKIIRAFSAAALALACIAAPGSSMAVPTNAFYRIYYSDMAHTNTVGEENRSCQSTDLVGQRTVYYDTIWEYNCNIVPGGDPCEGVPEGFECPF